MKNLRDFSSSQVQYIFTDIDDTLTTDGKLPASSYEALWRLNDNGFRLIPVTGRPAGWCEMIARLWPVCGVIGENGALYYRYENKKMIRHYAVTPSVIQKNRKKLDRIAKVILKNVKGAGIASDQFCRVFDLAIDFCEDVKPLKKDDVQRIVEIFKKHGAVAKVSSIHINGWFGKYDKLKMCEKFMKKEFQIDIKTNNQICAFIGDSPNDEPMFSFFKNSFAVANIQNFLGDLKYKPAYITSAKSGQGFVEFADHLISNKT